MEVPSLEALRTVAGASIVVVVILQVLWATWKPAAAVKDQFGPLVAIVTGIVVTVVATVVIGGATSADLVTAILNGLFAGAASMGIHDTVNAAGVKL